MAHSHGADSEVGTLTTVMLHRPGNELKRLTPRNNDELLFDGLPWVDRAQEEHDAFAGVLRSRGVEVLYLSELLTETLADADAREQAITLTLTDLRLGDRLRRYLKALALDLDPEHLAAVLMAGLRNDALPSCPECTADPRFLAQNTGIVAAISGPDGEPAQFGEVSSWAIPVEANAEAAQQFTTELDADARYVSIPALRQQVADEQAVIAGGGDADPNADPRVQAAVLGVTGALFVIPSLALFALLIPLLGIGTVPALVGLSSYCLLILVRNVVNGLQAVPPEVLDAADGLGYSRARRMREVELPLALPYIVAGVRLAMVTTIGIATIAAYINAGGLGAIIFAGIDQRYPEKILLGGGLVALLSIVTDTLLSRAERLVQA